MDFWPQSTTGVRYVRCELPARATGGTLFNFDTDWYSTDPGSRQGPSVWQMVGNRVRLHAMLQQQQYGPVYVEFDDDYATWHKQYVRGPWSEFDDPADPYTSSVEVIRAATEMADGVIVSTPHLARVYGEYNDNVFVCPNGVDPADWPEVPERDDVFRIVFAGSPNPNDLSLVRRAMEWAAQQPGVEAHMIHDMPLSWKDVRMHGWFESLARYRQFLSGLKPDLGLRPLEMTSFSKGKSDLKILEYAMAGALACVTPYDPYMDWSDTPVLMAHNAKEWERKVKWAVENRDEVRARAQELRETIIETRGLERIRSDWERVAEDRVRTAV